MIKYLGSKRRLVPVLGEILSATGARTALDLFTGTTRVAQEFKRRGAMVTAVDVARYSKVFADCYVATDASTVDKTALAAAIEELNRVPGRPGYVTDTFCLRSRYFTPANGARIDAVRDEIDTRFGGSPLHPVLLTSLIEAADRVDSTTGVQMAYLKQWARRAMNPLELRVPELLVGPGRTVRGDAVVEAGRSSAVDLAYLDPPYNQHRYFTNYHVWETLVAWDRPAHYGRACKRVDARDESTKSAFNRRGEMAASLARCVDAVDARLVVVSYNDEGWVTLDDLQTMAKARGCVQVLAFDSRRYVGAQIGIYNPAGVKVGRVERLHNREFLVLAGTAEAVAAAANRFASARLMSV
jgi:adenine-specific DNA-methyltransferase